MKTVDDQIVIPFPHTHSPTARLPLSGGVSATNLDPTAAHCQARVPLPSTTEPGI